MLSLLQDDLLTDSVRDPAGISVLIKWGKNPIAAWMDSLHASRPWGSIKNVYGVANIGEKETHWQKEEGWKTALRRDNISNPSNTSCAHKQAKTLIAHILYPHTHHANFLNSGRINEKQIFFCNIFKSTEQHIDTAWKKCPWMTDLSILAFVLDKQAHYWMS